MRRYLIAVYDVTDLTDDEETYLAGELDVQANVGVVIGSAVEAGDDVQHVGIFTEDDIQIGAVVKPSTVPVLDLSGGS